MDEEIIVNVNDYQMAVNPKDFVISHHLIKEGIYEPTNTMLLQKKIQEGDIALDLGAHIGYYTVLLSKHVGESGHVYAFEPEPTNFGFLKRNVKLNELDNVTLINKAVSDTNGSARLYLNDAKNTGGHRLYEEDNEREGIEVETICLDDYFKDYEGTIDFIKMNVQGSDYLVLRGMRGIIEHNKYIRIILRLFYDGIENSGQDPDDFISELEDLGFRLYLFHRWSGGLEPVTAEKLIRLFRKRAMVIRNTKDEDDYIRQATLYCIRADSVDLLVDE